METPIYSVAPFVQENTPEQGMAAQYTQSTDGDDFDDETTFDPDTSVWTDNGQNVWNDFDPLVTFNNVLNMLTCGPLGSLSQSERNNRRIPGVPRRIVHDNEFDTIASAIDTIDDRDDGGTEFRSMDSCDQTDIKSGVGRSSSSGDSSDDSCSMIRELQSTSASEGEIQVRSTIRDTMEKIVSNSKKGFHEDQSAERKWTSYEVREDEGPDVSTRNNKRETIKTFVAIKGGRKPFFFNLRTGKK
jgi:hypothetical protein